MSENQALYAATGASRSHEAEIIRERIKATLEHTFPALAAFLAHGEPTPGSGGSLCELADDAAALAELMAMFPPDAPKQPTPETTAHVSWLVQRLLTTSRACRSWWPALPWTRLKGQRSPLWFRPATTTLPSSGRAHPGQAARPLHGAPKAAEIAREFIAEGRSVEVHINPNRDGWPGKPPEDKNLVVLATRGVHRQYWYIDNDTVEALRPLATATA